MRTTCGLLRRLLPIKKPRWVECKPLKLKVLWDTREKTWKPLNMMKADEQITVEQYVKEKHV